MYGNRYLIVVLSLAMFGCAQSPQQSSAPAQVQISKAANPDVPQGVPAWKQGMSDAQATSTLAPHAAKNTLTPESEIPIANLKVPRGFKVEIWASGMPGARMMARGTQGTVWAGSRGIGRVYEIKDAAAGVPRASWSTSSRNPTASRSRTARST